MNTLAFLLLACWLWDKARHCSLADTMVKCYIHPAHTQWDVTRFLVHQCSVNSLPSIGWCDEAVRQRMMKFCLQTGHHQMRGIRLQIVYSVLTNCWSWWNIVYFKSCFTYFLFIILQWWDLWKRKAHIHSLSARHWNTMNFLHQRAISVTHFLLMMG